jgi:predicted small metal-binding protein
MPSFRCADIGMPELMQKIAEHAKTVHRIDPIPPDLLSR